MKEVKMHKVSVVVLNWNNLSIIEQCLNSLLQQTYENIEIIVVDNASIDGSRELINSRYPQITLLPQEINIGFAGGVNRGIARASGDYVALLNSDAVADQNWIYNLVEGIQYSNETWACASKMINYDDRSKIDSTGIRIFRSGRATDRGYGEKDMGQYDNKEEIFGPCGGAALYRRDVLNDIGRFDEVFFAYLEDVDVAWRARMAGFTTVYCPDAVVYHMRSKSTSKTSAIQRYYGARNRILIVYKNMPCIQIAVNLPIIILFELISIMYDTIKYLDFAQIKGKLNALITIVNYNKNTLTNNYGRHRITLMESTIKQLVFEVKRIIMN